MKPVPHDAGGLRSWDSYPERSTPFMISALVNTTRLLGRTVMRLVLWPIVLYFYLTAGDARRASRDYLRRVLEREPRAGKSCDTFTPSRPYSSIASTCSPMMIRNSRSKRG